jgi:hypothetical protein
MLMSFSCIFSYTLGTPKNIVGWASIKVGTKEDFKASGWAK